MACGAERAWSGKAAVAASCARDMMPATTASESCATAGAARQDATMPSTAAVPANAVAVEIAITDTNKES